MRVFFRLAALLMCLLAGPAPAADLAGSADHPLVGRYEGSEIIGYEFAEFDGYPLLGAAGKAGFQPIEGRVTRISYLLPENVTPVAAARNFEIALAGAGFEPLFECADKTCGEVSYDLDQFPIPLGNVDRFNYRVATYRLARAEGDVFASVIVSPNAKARANVQLAVIEVEPMEVRMIDAAEMQAEIDATGRVALYGIHFATDSARIEAESEPTMTEIARMLAARPELRVVIVGHTDNQGSLEYNLGLSHRRAQAVRDALVKSFGIDGARMEFAGAGFLAPVAPNTTEEGRALNRRVEVISR